MAGLDQHPLHHILHLLDCGRGLVGIGGRERRNHLVAQLLRQRSVVPTDCRGCLVNGNGNFLAIEGSNLSVTLDD